MSHFDISSEIYTLLHQKQEIGVPKLGVLKTKNQSIVLDRANGILSPKQRFVTDFEQNDSVNNTNLIEYVAYKRRISYAEAQEIVTNFVTLHKNVLNHQAVYFKNIGKLSKDQTGNIIFHPEQHNLSLEQYGLPVLKNVFPITLDKSKKSRPKVMSEPILNTTEQPTKSYFDVFFESNLLKGLVVCIFLLGIITTFIHYNKLNSENNNAPNTNESVAGMNSTDGLDANAIEAAKKLAAEEPDMDEDEMFVTDISEGEKEKEPIAESEEEIQPAAPEVEPTPKPTPIETDADFILLDDAVYVVIGSYGGLSNAKKSKNKAVSKGYVGKIEKRPNGHYRVMLELQMSKTAAQKELSTTIRKDYKKAWIAK